jgi:hypothetical protein
MQVYSSYITYEFNQRLPALFLHSGGGEGGKGGRGWKGGRGEGGKGEGGKGGFYRPISRSSHYPLI